MLPLYEGVTLDLETLTQYDGTGKCEFLRTWNLKHSKAYFEPPIFDEEDNFEDYELVGKWVQRMEMDWGRRVWNAARSNYMEILRNWRDFWSDYSDYEESFEPDDSEEEKDALNSDSEEMGVAEVDSGKNDLKEDSETIIEQTHQDLANMSVSVNCVGQDEESDGWVW